MKCLFAFGGVALLLALSGCAGTDMSTYAAKNGMHVYEAEGDGFTHLVAERRSDPSGRRLHVYIEGDGIPWSGNYPSADPTPRDMLTLRLANADTADVAYVGRPCYFRVETNPDVCHPRYWTSHRYSPEIIRSMAAVINDLSASDFEQVVLIGHSGGGVLAALLESEVEGVVAVVTVAANLDVDAWAEFHGYDPLIGSINPINVPRAAHIPHLQYVGTEDVVVPAATSHQYAGRQPGVQLYEIEEFGHTCCWEEIWPGAISSITSDSE